MKKHIFLLVSAITLASTTLYAQSSLSISYNYGILTESSLKSFINPNSPSGWQAEYQYFISPALSVGIASGYQGFYEKRDRATYVNESNNTSVNAVTWRYLTSIPVMGTAKYYFTDSNVKPYLGAGIGGVYNKQEIQYGDLLVSDPKFSFALQGEAGLLFAIKDTWGIIANAKYNYSFYKPADFDTKNIGLMQFGIGAYFNID